MVQVVEFQDVLHNWIAQQKEDDDVKGQKNMMRPPSHMIVVDKSRIIRHIEKCLILVWRQRTRSKKKN